MRARSVIRLRAQAKRHGPISVALVATQILMAAQPMTPVSVVSVPQGQMQIVPASLMTAIRLFVSQTVLTAIRVRPLPSKTVFRVLRTV